MLNDKVIEGYVHVNIWIVISAYSCLIIKSFNFQFLRDILVARHIWLFCTASADNATLWNAVLRHSKNELVDS